MAEFNSSDGTSEIDTLQASCTIDEMDQLRPYYWSILSLFLALDMSFDLINLDSLGSRQFQHRLNRPRAPRLRPDIPTRSSLWLTPRPRWTPPPPPSHPSSPPSAAPSASTRDAGLSTSRAGPSTFTPLTKPKADNQVPKKQKKSRRWKKKMARLAALQAMTELASELCFRSSCFV